MPRYAPDSSPDELLLSDTDTRREKDDLPPFESIIKRSYMPSVGIRNDLQSTNKYDTMFSVEEVCSTQHLLARMLRYIIYSNSVSMDEFSFKITKFYATLGQNMGKIHSIRNNIKKDVLRTPVTYMKFEQILQFLGFSITDFTITLRRVDTGATTTYKLSDIPKLYAGFSGSETTPEMAIETIQAPSTGHPVISLGISDPSDTDDDPIDLSEDH